MTKENLTAKAKKVKEEGIRKYLCGVNAAKNAALARVLKGRNSGNTK